MTQSAMKKIQLTHPQFFQLCGWLQRNSKEVLAQPTTYAELAKHAEMALNFKVSDHSIPKALEATGLGSLYKSKSGVRPLKADGASLRTLGLAVIHLYTRLGEPIPEDLRNLANH